MNLLLLADKEIDEAGRVVLSGHRAQHVREVLRARPGDRLRVGVVRGSTGTATVVTLSDGDEEVVLDVSLDTAAVVTPSIDVILAVPRPKVLPRVLEMLASFGVRRIDLCNAWRVDKSYLGSHRLAEAALHDALVRGCEQGVTTWVPDVAVHPLLVPFLEDTLAPRLAAERDRQKLMAHPKTTRLLEDAVSAGPVVVALGPEGGWIEAELDSFAALGFVAVSMGPAILRVEAAAAALLGQLTLWQRLPAQAQVEKSGGMGSARS
jgi:RsmE family RNA methyltransferase